MAKRINPAIKTEVLSRLRKGETVRSISRHLGVSRPAIRDWAMREGITPVVTYRGRISPENRNAIKLAYEKGESATSIAKSHKVTTGAITYILKVLRVAIRKPEVLPSGIYKCTKCLRHLSQDSFYVGKNGRKYSWCIECCRQAVKLRPSRDGYKKPSLALRLELIAAYGGKCQCCGETRHEFLSCDHSHNDGNVERSQLGINGGGYHFYRRLKARGWPQDRYRLLCMNCNTAIGFFGYCPHAREGS